HADVGALCTDPVVFYASVEKKHPAAGEFDVASMTALPRVDVIMTYQGASGDLIKAAVDNGAKGIVLAPRGAGAPSGLQGEGVQYALEKGVFVGTTPRTGSGRIAARNRPAPDATTTMAGTRGSGGGSSSPRERAIAGEDLAPVKARILLMLALARTQSPADIQRIFIEY